MYIIASWQKVGMYNKEVSVNKHIILHKFD